MKKEIKIYGSFLIKDKFKLEIDKNLYFDISKVSYISEEIFYKENIENKTYLYFYFFITIDGVYYQIIDNTVLSIVKDINQEIKEIYPNLIVFKLRKSILENTFLS